VRCDPHQAEEVKKALWDHLALGVATIPEKLT